jgi:hypothetical protein
VLPSTACADRDGQELHPLIVSQGKDAVTRWSVEARQEAVRPGNHAAGAPVGVQTGKSAIAEILHYDIASGQDCDSPDCRKLAGAGTSATDSPDHPRSQIRAYHLSASPVSHQQATCWMDDQSNVRVGFERQLCQ